MRMKPEEVEKFNEELVQPLEGESRERRPVSQETIERENDNFDAVLGMIGG